MPAWGDLLVAAGILIGLLGIVIPMLPGSVLVLASILVWSAIVGGQAWIVFGIALLLILAGMLVKYLVAGRVLQASGIPGRTIIVAALVGLVGFFVIPVIGLFLGFVAGAMVAEFVRSKTVEQAWRGTVAATKASVYTIGIELFTALLATAVWLAGVRAW
ncbi:MAG: DUF456 domain-containing protein [Gordonia sp. (in: high G+C Gram-positive bacteria)]